MNLTLNIKAKYPKGKTNKETLEDVKSTLEMLEFTNVSVKNEPQTRSKLLNDTLHLWFTKIEGHCRGYGHTADTLVFRKSEDGVYREEMKTKFNASKELISWVFDKTFPELSKTSLPITSNMVKSYFQGVSEIQFGKNKTSKMTNYEICEVVRICEAIFAKRLDYKEEFPNREVLRLGKLKSKSITYEMPKN